MAKAESPIDFARDVVEQANSGDIHPAMAIARLVSRSIETPDGLQPAFLVAPTAVLLGEYRPNIMTTLLTPDNRIGDLRQILPADNGGIRLCMRATSDPRLAP